MSCDLSDVFEGPASGDRDQEDIASFFLASDLVIEGFAMALQEFLSPRTENLREPPSVAPDSEGRRGRGVDAPPGETYADVMAARCAILLLLDLVRDEGRLSAPRRSNG